MQHTAEPFRVGGICFDQPKKWERALWVRVAPFLVLVNIALNPFPHTTSIREVSYYSAVALLIFYFWRYRDWSAIATPFTIPVAVFTGWACVGLFWALDVSASLHDIRAHLLKYIVLFLLLTIFFNSRARIRVLFWTIIVSVLVSGLYDMYFFYVVGKNSFLLRMAIPYHQLPVGPLGFMALFAAMLAVHLWRTGEGLWGKCVLALCLAGILLILFVTQMRSLLFALPLVVIALFWDNKKILALLMLAVVFFSAIFFITLRDPYHSGSYTDRLTINYMSLLLIKENPITGIGFSIETPGNRDLIDHEALRAKVPPKIKNDIVKYNNPHNMWLGIAVRLGVPGFFLFLLIVIAGGRVCLAAMGHEKNRELRLAGQLCLSLLLLFLVYGLFNEVFMHLLEPLLCLVFVIISSLNDGMQKKPRDTET